MKIWNETDPVSGTTIAWEDRRVGRRATTTIWMDGRSHPPENAAHERGGFTTGAWEGSTLVAHHNAHEGRQIRRNGAPAATRRR